MVSSFWKDKLRSMPTSPGVYLMRDAAGRIIYIGKAINLRRRVSSYFRDDVDDKVAGIINALRHIDYILAASEREALIVERDLINRYQPYFNSMWRDDKSYPYLKLTLKEDFPRLVLTRKVIKDGSEYFGPYPQVMHIRRLMHWMQRMFKWRPCNLELSRDNFPPVEKVKSCMYYHTEQCSGPCMGKISPEDYKRATNEIRMFLRHRYKKLESYWAREMKQFSRNMQYERAADLRDRIQAIRSMQERVTVRELQPEDLAMSIQTTRTLEELKDNLRLPKWPIVIEGFDISLISGTNPVGSMVRFLNGQPDKSNYRKYRIMSVAGTDDFAMMKEVVYRRYRRLKEEKRDLPDLILIDGGKGQLSAAQKSLTALELTIPMVSIAKQEEELFLPDEKDSIKLPQNSPALQLLRHIRDEAHRFALAYHHLRREKALGLDRP